MLNLRFGTHAFFRINVVILILIIITSTLAADDEKEEAVTLAPNIENGMRIYEKCAICHAPTGWGDAQGRYPQIAGQYKNVIIKEFIDIRTGNRDNPVMDPFSHHGILGGPQNIADVAAYIARLPISTNNEIGPGNDLTHGVKLYQNHCAKCHGANGEGSNEDFCPRLQGQHFSYVLRQLQWLKSNQRQNTHIVMMRKIKNFSERDMIAAADFISRLRPPPELTGPDEKHNSDFIKKFPILPPAP